MNFFILLQSVKKTISWFEMVINKFVSKYKLSRIEKAWLIQLKDWDKIDVRYLLWIQIIFECNYSRLFNNCAVTCVCFAPKNSFKWLVNTVWLLIFFLKFSCSIILICSWLVFVKKIPYTAQLPIWLVLIACASVLACTIV